MAIPVDESGVFKMLPVLLLLLVPLLVLPLVALDGPAAEELLALLEISILEEYFPHIWSETHDLE